MWLRLLAAGGGGLLIAVLAAALPALPGGAPPRHGAVETQPAGDRLYVLEGFGAGLRRLASLDAASGARERELPLGAPSPDWSTLYTVEREQGWTTVRAHDLATGRVLREAAFEGDYELPPGPPGAAPGGLSPDGRWLVIAQLPGREEIASSERASRRRSRFLVLDSTFQQPPRQVDLDGNFGFDAIDAGGAALYLIEHLPSLGPTRYQVRLYDLAAGALEPGVIADKRGVAVMSGIPNGTLRSADGQWLYSLYLNSERGPFIHALNLPQRFAVCVVLSPAGKEDRANQLLWSLALSPDGQLLYAVNGGLGLVAEIDTRLPDVRRAATFAVDRATSLRLGLLRWLRPVAEAKRLPQGGAALTADGRTLFALGETGLIALGTADLAARTRYLPDQPLDSVAVSAGGAGLYVVNAERGAILHLDAAGESARHVGGARAPWSLLRVEARP